MSERWAVTEALQCHPGTAGSVHKHRSEGIALGRCPPPQAGESGVLLRGGTVEPPRGPCSPSAAAGTLVLVLSETQTYTFTLKQWMHTREEAHRRRGRLVHKHFTLAVTITWLTKNDASNCFHHN